MSDERFHERLGARLHDAILEHAYGELPPREARALERHLEVCEACRAELARLRGTRALMSGLGEAPAPERGEAVLLAAAREAAGARARRRRLPAWTWGAALSAAALLAVGAVSYRLLALHPGPALREDPEALLGRAPAAQAGPEAGAPAAAPEAPEAPAAAAAPAPAPGAGYAERAPPAAPPAPERRREAPRPLAAAKSAPPAAAPAGEAEVDADASTAAAPRTFLAPAPPPAPAPRALRADAGNARDAEAAAPSAAGAAPSATLEAAPGAADAPSAPRRAAPAIRGQAQEAAAAPAGPDALARWRALRQAGALRGEVVTFTDCDGEAWRKVESDPEGRVVRYARHGRLRGRAFEAELYYAEDGALALARYREEGGPWREARPPVSAGAIPAAALQPARAAAARADAPPRCGP